MLWTRALPLRVAFSSVVVAASFSAVTWALPAQAQAPQPAPDIRELKALYQRPPARPIENKALVELGRLLFWDPRISGSGKTACVTCHLPYLGWATTDDRSRSDSGRRTSRKSQTLLGLGHADGVPVGWDGRSATLEAQIKSSVGTGSMSMHNTDTPVKIEVIEARIRDIPQYVEGFKAALPNTPINIDSIATAIAAYERTMEPGPAPFDRWIAGDEAAISESAKVGSFCSTPRPTVRLATAVGVSPMTASMTSVRPAAISVAGSSSRA
jgi:cytochrome c peroxidase